MSAPQVWGTYTILVREMHRAKPAPSGGRARVDLGWLTYLAPDSVRRLAWLVEEAQFVEIVGAVPGAVAVVVAALRAELDADTTGAA